MDEWGSWLSQFISVSFFHRKNVFFSFCFFQSKVFSKKKNQNMLFARCSNDLNKENSDSMKVFSGLVITFYRISSEVKFCPCLSIGGKIKPG